MAKSAYWLDGSAADCLSLDDRALHYGDGVFETVAVHRERPLLLDDHLDRLMDGCRRLLIAPMIDRSRLEQRVRSSARAMDRGVLKIIVTRGSGARGYRPPERGRPRCIVGVYAWPEFPRCRYEQGVTVRLCELRLSHQPRLAGIKHLNRLEQVLARAEWTDEWEEGLMLDENDTIIEGTMSNFFVVLNNALVTPSLERTGVRGVMRNRVLRAAAELGVRTDEHCVRVQDLPRAREAFLTNSVIGIWPIRTIGRHRYSVGAVTRQLQDAIREANLAIIP